ncbi:MAG: gamma-glutamylcyclotransferase [Dehalococcoidia bacterium]
MPDAAPDAPDAPDAPFLYFAYGSNLDAARLRMHCPSAHLVSIARLADYRLAFSIESKRSWLGGVGDILEAPGDETWGALWAIDGEHSRALDAQEGVFRDPPAYRRLTVEVSTPAGDIVRCRSYQVAAPDMAGFLPSPAYKQTIVRGAQALGLPSSYVARLEALPDNGVDGGQAH